MFPALVASSGADQRPKTFGEIRAMGGSAGGGKYEVGGAGATTSSAPPTFGSMGVAAGRGKYEVDGATASSGLPARAEYEVGGGGEGGVVEAAVEANRQRVRPFTLSISLSLSQSLSPSPSLPVSPYVSLSLSFSLSLSRVEALRRRVRPSNPVWSGRPETRISNSQPSSSSLLLSSLELSDTKVYEP